MNKKYLKELLKIKTLSNFFNLRSLLNLKIPESPSCTPELFFVRSHFIISSISSILPLTNNFPIKPFIVPDKIIISLTVDRTSLKLQ